MDYHVASDDLKGDEPGFEDEEVIASGHAEGSVDVAAGETGEGGGCGRGRLLSLPYLKRPMTLDLLLFMLGGSRKTCCGGPSRMGGLRCYIYCVRVLRGFGGSDRHMGTNAQLLNVKFVTANMDVCLGYMLCKRQEFITPGIREPEMPPQLQTLSSA